MRFNRFLVDAIRPYRRVNRRPMPSPIRGFEGVKALVLLPHQGHDDYREHEDNRYHYDQLEHRSHAKNIATAGLFDRRGSAVSALISVSPSHDVVTPEIRQYRARVGPGLPRTNARIGCVIREPRSLTAGRPSRHDAALRLNFFPFAAAGPAAFFGPRRSLPGSGSLEFGFP